MRPWRTRTFLAALAGAALLAAAAGARAEDKVRTSAGIGYGGKIVGVTAEGLVIEVAGAKRSVPLTDIAYVSADAYPDLALAEEAYAKGLEGDAKALADAGRLYQGLLRRSAPAWLRVFIEFRMYGLYAGSGRVAEALDAFLDMAGTSPKLVADLRLPDPIEGDADNKAMLAKVGKAIEAAGDKPYVAKLNSLQVLLRILEGTPAEALPLLEPLLTSTDEKVRRSAMFKQLELLLATGDADQAQARLEQVDQALGTELPDAMAYWRGRILEQRGEARKAALEYMRLPILYAAKDRQRTADALWRTGKALEAAGAPRDEAVKVYKEAVDQYAGTAGAERSRRELARLGAR